jgi:hypothetical protein
LTEEERLSYESKKYPERCIVSIYPSEPTDEIFFEHRYYLHKEFLTNEENDSLSPNFETDYSATLCYKCNTSLSKNPPPIPEYSIAK